MYVDTVLFDVFVRATQHQFKMGLHSEYTISASVVEKVHLIPDFITVETVQETTQSYQK